MCGQEGDEAVRGPSATLRDSSQVECANHSSSMLVGNLSLSDCLMSQLLQPLDELTGETIRIEAIQEVGPQFDIRRLALQYVIDDGQQRMTQRHDRSLLAPPGRQAVILRRQVCPLGVARRPRGLFLNSG